MQIHVHRGRNRRPLQPMPEPIKRRRRLREKRALICAPLCKLLEIHVRVYNNPDDSARELIEAEAFTQQSPGDSDIRRWVMPVLVVFSVVLKQSPMAVTIGNRRQPTITDDNRR